MRNSERGNALWFILVAIVLLGALTVVLSRSGSSVNQTGDVEQMRVKASQVLRYGKGIEAAIEQMKLNGISENEISFQNAETATNYTNGNCDTATDTNYPGCLLFNAGGAGLTYQDAPPGTFTTTGGEWIFTGANNIGGMGTDGAGTGNDLVMLLANPNTTFCTQVNRDMEIGSSIPVDSDTAQGAAFTGTFVAGLTLLDGDTAPPGIEGKSAGCFRDDNNTNYFYYVLLAR